MLSLVYSFNLFLLYLITPGSAVLQNLRGLLSFVPSKIVQIALVFGTVLLITIAGYDIPASVAVSKDTNNYLTFTDWCLNKETLQSDTRDIVNKMLTITAIYDCKQARQKLSEIKLFALSGSSISDIRSLKFLT